MAVALTNTQYNRWVDPVDGEVLTDPDGVAIILGCSQRTAFRYVSKGKVEVRRQPSGKALIAVRSLRNIVIPPPPSQLGR